MAAVDGWKLVAMVANAMVAKNRLIGEGKTAMVFEFEDLDDVIIHIIVWMVFLHDADVADVADVTLLQNINLSLSL